MTTVTSGQSKTPTATSPAGSGKIRKFSSLLHGQAAEEESFFPHTRHHRKTGEGVPAFPFPSPGIAGQIQFRRNHQISRLCGKLFACLPQQPNAEDRAAHSQTNIPRTMKGERLQKPTRKYCRRHQTHNRRRPPEIRGGRRLQRTTTRKSELYFPVIFPLESVTAQK